MTEIANPILSEKPLWREYMTLCKPRVVALMLLTAIVGMALAPVEHFPWLRAVLAILGIAGVASSAAALNHFIDRHLDDLMLRTQRRPLPTGRISNQHALYFAAGLGLVGLIVLVLGVNLLTAGLTFLTLIGYAVVYTIFLKHATPQNIVIGGLAGAAPPLLGWTSVTNHVDPYSLLLVLIIFVWTPPHFWALAIYRFKDYRNAKIPMLPVTHGLRFTKLCIFLYTLLLLPISLLPYVTGMSHGLYAVGALVLGLIFMYWAWRLLLTTQARVALQTFRYSIYYLAGLFTMLLLDHFI